MKKDKKRKKKTKNEEKEKENVERFLNQNKILLHSRHIHYMVMLYS